VQLLLLNREQGLRCDATSGTAVLRFLDQNTVPLAWNAAPAAVQVELFLFCDHVLTSSVTGFLFRLFLYFYLSLYYVFFCSCVFFCRCILISVAVLLFLLLHNFFFCYCN
jgi:hypothetical protein